MSSESLRRFRQPCACWLNDACMANGPILPTSFQPKQRNNMCVSLFDIATGSSAATTSLGVKGASGSAVHVAKTVGESLCKP